MPQDAGDYICQIATLEPREITHTVEILGKFDGALPHEPLQYSRDNELFCYDIEVGLDADCAANEICLALCTMISRLLGSMKLPFAITYFPTL